MNELHSTLFLAWQDDKSRSWFPIGRLKWNSSPTDRFEFRYTCGFERAHGCGLEPLVGFPEVDRIYQAVELFPQFRNRIMHASRDDFGAYLQRLNLVAGDQPSMALMDMEILARSGGRRSTDSFEVFPLPIGQQADGTLLYQVEFFVHGLRHVPQGYECALKLRKGERLRLMADWQNSVDANAVMIRSDANALLGWLPRYFCEDVAYLRERSMSPEVIVERVNAHPAPVQQALLARLTAHWPSGPRLPLDGPEYRPISPAPDAER